MDNISMLSRSSNFVVSCFFGGGRWCYFRGRLRVHIMIQHSQGITHVKTRKAMEQIHSIHTLALLIDRLRDEQVFFCFTECVIVIVVSQGRLINYDANFYLY